MKKATKERENRYPVLKSIIGRWSPRAMSGEKLTDKEIKTIFEAARWAPSSYNSQPWRFVYGKRGSKHWDKLFDLLVEFNQEWCKNAGVLVVVISRDNFEHNKKYSRTHSFDTGSAWENLAVQATSMNLVAHGMAGFDYEKARKVLKIPKGYTIECMIALGRPGKLDMLPPSIAKNEKITKRKPLKDLISEGEFKWK